MRWSKPTSWIGGVLPAAGANGTNLSPEAGIETPAPIATPVKGNPFYSVSILPYRLPPFDRIRESDFAPAFDRGMAEQQREIETIATNPATPDFDNTLAAMERSGQVLTRVSAVFFNLAAANVTPGIHKIETELAPRLAAHHDAILLDPKLFARIDLLYRKRETLGLNAEQKHLVERYHTDFVRAGARLSPPQKGRLRGLNARIAELETEFQQRLLKATTAAAVLVGNRGDLAGLTPEEIESVAAAAEKTGHQGEFLLKLQNTTQQPLLASLENRKLRQQILRASMARGAHPGAADTRPLVAELVRRRAERAQLLGYSNHAAYELADSTAGTTTAVNDMLSRLTPAATANAEREAADLQQLIGTHHPGFRLTASDWTYYAEKLRRACYDYDESEVQPYFELYRVVEDGVFYAASRLYGLQINRRTDLPTYHPDVRVYEVFTADGSPLGLILTDYYAREGKHGGAWMSSFVDQSTLLGTHPVILNNLNVPRPLPGRPTLLSFDEVTTLFHEFGHTLHGLLSNVTYPTFSGTGVPRDFVEYPSQVNEMWATWPAVLKHYARHYKTNEPMPKALLDKVLASRKFNQGYATTEYLAAALLDQAWHQLAPGKTPTTDAVEAFEAAALKRAGVDLPYVPPRYRSPYFAHLFADGYAAGYYAYIWSEVLDADTVEWFKAHGGLKRSNGDRFRKDILSRGGSADPMALFEAFYGAKPDIKPLLKRRGLEPGDGDC